ncbi:threonine--tRNA ligase [Candidatus Soleaferrea massiliensis]|uniref:threonine--tRNA ligase n=1 Tax=Candidatus Soleaferrea massiliensis TaxID=1470354 RepID=UPI00058CDCD0|nr:threonine--tRNA ligase [Candidatus Soleaferrea massiliensis]
MIHVTLKGGTVKAYESGTTVYEIAGTLDNTLYKIACCGKIDGKAVDLRTPVETDCELQILTFEDIEGQKTFWHTASHILAQAVKRLYPNAKLAIGPAVDNGFYYDFDVETAFTPEDLQRIEAEMKKIVRENLKIERFSLPAEEAMELMKDEPYKLELIREHAGRGETISFYKQGEFADLCAGPHLMDTSKVKAFRLTQSTGSYWRGDSSRQMLCRVYGTAYPKQAELDAYLARVEEAKKRDHNVLGRQLKYFTTCETVGQGLPLLMPKGAKVIQILQRYVEDLEEANGYVLTRTPMMAKSDLYKISGHWDHYLDGMFVLGDEEKDKEVFALRPMTCPFQYMIYKNDLHSYKDLPIRYAETSTLFRNEASGEMHGLIRVRQFTLSDGHLIVTPEQVEAEFRGVVRLIQTIMTDLGIIDEISYRFSKWDPNDKEKYIDAPETWEKTETEMRAILDHLGIDYVEAAGEAAFYGPKLDIQMKNVHGKEDTLITVQIDFALAERFDMVYVDADGIKKHPYIIHRSSIGCYERTLAMLIEKYAGALPLWLSPVQVAVLPMGEGQHEYAGNLASLLKKSGLRVTQDTRREKIGYKIREAQLEKIPYMLIIGNKEMEENKVAVRSRKNGDLGAMPVDEFIAMCVQEVQDKKN